LLKLDKLAALSGISNFYWIVFREFYNVALDFFKEDGSVLKFVTILVLELWLEISYVIIYEELGGIIYQIGSYRNLLYFL